AAVTGARIHARRHEDDPPSTGRRGDAEVEGGKRPAATLGSRCPSGADATQPAVEPGEPAAPTPGQGVFARLTHPRATKNQLGPPAAPCGARTSTQWPSFDTYRQRSSVPSGM